MMEKIIKKLKEELTLDELKEMVSDVNCWNGQLDDYYWYENDEWFFQDFFGHKVDEAVRAVCYGNYEYMDDYVQFNAYGNLDSCSELEYDKQIEDGVEEIIEVYLDNIREMSDGDLKNKIKRIMIDDEE